MLEMRRRRASTGTGKLPAIRVARYVQQHGVFDLDREMRAPLIKPHLLLVNLGLLTTGEMVSKVFTLVAFAHLARVLGPGSLYTLCT